MSGVRGLENTQPYVVVLIPDSPLSKNVCVKRPRLESDLGYCFLSLCLVLLRAVAFTARRIHAWWSLFPGYTGTCRLRGARFRVFRLEGPALNLTWLRKCLWPRWPAGTLSGLSLQSYHLSPTSHHLMPSKGKIKNSVTAESEWLTPSTGWRVLCRWIPLLYFQ